MDTINFLKFAANSVSLRKTKKRAEYMPHDNITQIRKTLKWDKKPLKWAAKNEMKRTGVIFFTLPSIYSQIRASITPKIVLKHQSLEN